MWSSWANVLLGIWLIASPFIFGFTGLLMWHNIIVGVLVGVLAYISIAMTGKADLATRKHHD